MKGERLDILSSLLKVKRFYVLFFSLVTSLLAEVQFAAKKIVYFPDNKVVILKDSASARDKDNLLTADSIFFFEDSSLLKAYGHAMLITGKDSFFGDSLYYNTKMRSGYAFNGYTLKEKGKIWGKESYKDSLDNIYIRRGFYTTCDKNPPHYYFQSTYMKVIKKEMAIAKPVILKVHNVPLFYVPFWMFPVKEGRKSGFLTPHIGYNSSSGKYFRNLAYYLVINNYMDVTFSLDLIENVGIKGNVDLIYKLYKKLSGEVQYSRAENLWSGRRDWAIKGWHRQTLSHGVSLSARFDYLSSYDYLNQYSETVVEWLKKEMYSYITLTKSTPPVPVTLTLDDRIKPDKKQRESLLPLIQYSLPALHFLNLRASGSIMRKRYEDSIRTYYRQGLANHITTSYNITLLHYIRLQTGAQVSTNILPKDSLMQSYTLQKGISMQSSIATTLYGFSLFGLPFLHIKKFVHVFSPQASFGYTPYIHNDSVFFQYGSRYTPGKYLSLRITNSFLAKKDSTSLKLLDLNLSASYNFEQKKWSNIPVYFSLSQKLPVKIRGSFTFSPDSMNINNTSIYLNSNFSLKLPVTSFNYIPAKNDSERTKTEKSHNRLSISINYTISQNQTFTTQTLGISSNFRITPSITGSYALSYDLERGKFLNRTLNIKKDLHCWALTFSYNRYGDIWDYSFRLFIKKIPDIKIDKGFVKDILP